MRIDVRVKRIYRKAIDILRERGWTQFVIEDCDGKVCVKGAIGIAADGDCWSGLDDFNGPANRLSLAGKAVKYLGKATTTDPAVWNNRSTTTIEDVITQLQLLGEVTSDDDDSL